MIRKSLALKFLFFLFCPFSLYAQTVSPTLQVRRICVDPALGGSVLGAAVKDPHLVEKDLDLTIAQKVVDLLSREKGVTLFMTRSSDVDKTWDDRAEFTNSRHCDLFVSIECGSSEGLNVPGVFFEIPDFEDLSQPDLIARAQGTPVIFNVVANLDRRNHQQRSYSLAELMAQKLHKGLGLPIHSIRKMKTYSYDALQMPGIWIELNLMNDPKEAHRLGDPVWQDKIAQAIAEGILDYKKKVEDVEAVPASTEIPVNF